MEDIGFPILCICDKPNMSIHERIKFFSSVGATALNLDFFSSESLKKFKLSLSPEMIKDIEKFNSVFIHHYWEEKPREPGTGLKWALEKLKYFHEKLSVKGIVMHPFTSMDFSVLEDSGLPFLFENTDKNKTLGKTPEYFEKLKKDYKFNFVLDVQHAYEQDHSMDLCKKLIETMGNRLKLLHVSGCVEKWNHFPVHISENKNEIAKILKLKLNAPKILEGVLFGDISKVASNELDFIRKYEKD